MTLSIMTLSITTLSITTFSITAFIITTLSITTINNQSACLRYSAKMTLSIIVLSANMLSVVC